MKIFGMTKLTAFLLFMIGVIIPPTMVIILPILIHALPGVIAGAVIKTASRKAINHVRTVNKIWGIIYEHYINIY